MKTLTVNHNAYTQPKNIVRISELSDSEYKIYKRNQKMMRERRQRRLYIGAAIASALLIFVLGVFFYGSTKSNANEGFKYYTSVVIEAGDTVESIADNYIDYNHYSSKAEYLKEVKRMNWLDDDYKIKAGEILIVPYYSNDFVY